MGMAAMPSAAFSAWPGRTIYQSSPKAARLRRLKIMQNTNQTRPDFRKALDGVLGARNREATRQISRPYEFQLIGAITKRPN